MINSLKLSYFRQHIEREFNFAGGINAIRGENEAGKTTVLESFAYLCFGARALRESLDDVVTYHQPVSKLRVEGVLTHLGVEYKAYRAKSGAEVTFGNERVTGQTEVTKFFEQLFGADAEMAGKLMIANQKSLADSITAGATEAGRMIEDLANFSLIDEIVELVQQKVVSGVTTGIEGRIASLEAQVADVDKMAEVFDLSMLELDVAEKEVVASSRRLELENIQDKRDNLDVDLAKSILADEKAHQTTIETTAFELDALDRKLAVAAPVAPTDAELSAARAAVEAEKQIVKATAIHRELSAAAIEEGEWDKDLASLEADTADTEVKRVTADADHKAALSAIDKASAALAAEKQATALAIKEQEGKLIKETSCAFCDKDLTDVPEVVQRNSAAGKAIEKLSAAFKVVQLSTEAQLAGLGQKRDDRSVDLQNATSYLAALRAVLTRNDKAELLYARAADFITVDRSMVPGRWTWAGPTSTAMAALAGAALRALELRQTEAVTFAATRAAQQKQRNELKVKQDAAILSRNSLQVKDAIETLADAAVLDGSLVTARAALDAAKDALTQAQATLNTKVELQKQAAKAVELTKKQLAGARQELVDMQANNALIKKVRAARPVITDKLWTIVLAGVTQYFSEVRGEFSSITRGDKTFKCNGQPAAGLSGSAQDMLGLAIRIALTKTFLPGCDFLLLDEPAAACSDHRETAMLGLLATLGFGQIILVSHSTMVDAFADNVVTI